MPFVEFFVFTVVSIIVVILAVKFSLNSRIPNPVKKNKNILFLIILELICMVIAKYGANFGFPWWIYYPVPMLLTVFFPLLYFKMSKKEAVKYLILIFVASPVIHVLFSLVGWKNYMPFIEIPSLI